MCLGVPLRIISIDGLEGVCGRDGVSRAVRLDFIKEPKVGDYVLVHAGFAIERMAAEEAEESIAAAREVEDMLKEMANGNVR